MRDARRLTAALVLGAGVWAAGPPVAADEGSTGIFVRADSDRTVVITPRASLGTVVNRERTRFDASYAADIWTSASIDIRTAATHRITEQRDQVDASVTHELADWNLGGSYYFSYEPDYVSHGASFFTSQELAEGSTTLEQRLLFAWDTVGRVGDPRFERPVLTLGGRVAFTQAIDADTLLQAVYEVSYREGYQASPYRYVGMGGDGRCGGSAELCIPESHPGIRWRHAAVLRARRALSDDSSLGLAYRLYRDSWGVLSHTGTAQLAWITGDDSTLTFQYRFYVQSGAGFYRSAYPVLTGQRLYVTRDRELSPMFSNRVALSYETLFRMGDSGTVLRLALAVGGTAFVYRDFVGLDQVYALDTGLAVSLEL
jgi:hypothetical protein